MTLGAVLSDAEIETLSRGIWPGVRDPRAIVLRFPSAPPSTNNLYVARRDGKGRAKTSQYKAWAKEAQLLVMASGCPREGWKHVGVEVRAPINYQRDVDNLKPVLDVLVTMGVIHDDCWVDEYLVRRVPVTEPLEVAVWRLRV